MKFLKIILISFPTLDSMFLGRLDERLYVLRSKYLETYRIFQILSVFQSNFSLINANASILGKFTHISKVFDINLLNNFYLD